MLLEVCSGIKSFFACLDYPQGLEQLPAIHLKGDELSVKGEHVVKMLLLDDSRGPNCSEATFVYDDEVMFRGCLKQQIGNEVT